MVNGDEQGETLRDKMAQLRDLCAERTPKHCGHGVSKPTDMQLLRDIETLEEEIAGLEQQIKALEA